MKSPKLSGSLNANISWLALVCFGWVLITSCGNDKLTKVDFKANPKSMAAQVVNTLALGSEMPSFRLFDATAERYFSSSELKKAKAVVIGFFSNHCTTSQAYEQRILDIAESYKEKGVRVVLISPTSPLVLPFEEMSYSDLDDSYESMVIRARDQNFPFPYLYDGDDHAVTLKFGPKVTPEFFLFDAQQKLRYKGHMDGSESPGTAQGERLRNAINAVLEDRAIIRADLESFGCPIRWSWDSTAKVKADLAYLEKPISLEAIDLDSVRTLLINFSPKVRLINFWATWCGPCKVEFPELLKMNRMYGDRLFEFVSISLDSEEKEDEALAFLQQVHSPGANFICSHKNKEELIAKVYPQWDGSLPFTIAVEPYGQIYKVWTGPIDPLTVKKAILNHHRMGRYR